MEGGIGNPESAIDYKFERIADESAGNTGCIGFVDDIKMLSAVVLHISICNNIFINYIIILPNHRFYLSERKHGRFSACFNRESNNPCTKP